MILAVDENTPLPPNKFIGITLGFSAGENDLAIHPNMQGLTDIISSEIITYSSSSGTHIIGFSVAASCRAQAKNSSGKGVTPIDTFSAASLYVNIVTDGIELLLDKTQSVINEQGTS